MPASDASPPTPMADDLCVTTTTRSKLAVAVSKTAPSCLWKTSPRTWPWKSRCTTEPMMISTSSSSLSSSRWAAQPQPLRHPAPPPRKVLVLPRVLALALELALELELVAMLRILMTTTT